MSNLLHKVIASQSSFAVLHRADGPGVEVLLGEVIDVERLADIPLPGKDEATFLGVLAMLPFRQVVERGFACHDDGTPLRCLVVRQREVLDLAEAIAILPDVAIDVTERGFDIDDDDYAQLVRRVIDDEIGRGEGANFVIRRDFLAHTSTPAPQAALALLRRLLLGESHAYWTFAVHAGDRTLVGATPERHVSMTDGQALMNPISGTYRFPPDGATCADLLRFLSDTKETEELFMVVDEELKMMSQICERGGQVRGPYLKQMSALAHTEYLLRGSSDMDVRDILRETMFAPTVTGSPVENALRVITRYESTGRGYYAGVLALIDRGVDGRPTLDAPILIRTAQLDPAGEIRVSVGATLVRHSIPADEAAETRAKVAGVLRALGVPHSGPTRTTGPAPRLAECPGVAAALSQRNGQLAPFWLSPQRDRPMKELTGRKALIVNAEDAWTAMLAHLLRRIGMATMVVRWDEAPEPAEADLLVAGPGPGDPRNTHEPRIARLHELVHKQLTSERPLLAVCLSHQVLAQQLGLPVQPLPEPYQGTQRRIDLFGNPVRAAYYNTYAAATSLEATAGLAEQGIEVAADPDRGEVHALRGPGFASVQFHLESVLTPDGAGLLRDLVTALVRTG
jgi:2-amino-4-deoxychorismate synthase